MDVRVDSAGMEYVEFDGERRMLGCLPPKEISGFPKFGAAAAGKIIPMADWKEIDYAPYVPFVDDQNGRNACVGHGVASGFDVAWAIAGGKRLKFSPWYVYSLINGGRDSGAIVTDGLEVLKAGVCLDASVADKVYLKRQIEQAAFEEAKRFRLFEGYELGSFLEMGSALMCGFVVPFGVLIGNAFTPGSDGRVPEWRGRTGGHCMLAVGLKLFGSKWYIKVLNSWSERFGLKGYCYMPQSYFDGQPWKTDAFAIQAVTPDPQDLADDPVVPSEAIAA